MLKRSTAVAMLLFLSALAPALAQEYRGNLYLTVSTEDGRPLVEAEVAISGFGGRRTAMTDDRGQVRFIKLEPGRYEIEIGKDGFATKILRGVVVNTSANTEMDVSLERTRIHEEVVVTAITPLLDKRRTGTSTVLNPEEVDDIPTARDPWAIMSMIPGIQTDRPNCGGDQSGMQAAFVSKGARHATTTWVMDRLEFTDLAALGATSTYFHWNSFNEIGFTTAGGDLEQLTPGVRLNFTTKQGMNRLSGRIGLLLANRDLQDSSPNPTQPDGERFEGDRIDEVFEKSFEIGGPIVVDKAWYWLGFSQNDIALLEPDPGGTVQTERTKLRNYTGKLNANLGGRTSLKGFFTEGDKIVAGRGAGVSRPPATTWNQTGPSPISTLDFSHFFNPNVEVSAQYGHVHGGFQLTPQGTADQIRWDADLVFRDTFWDGFYDRPQHQYAVRGNWFADTGRVAHELKFGFKYKEAEVVSTSGYGLQDVIAVEWLGQAWLYRQVSLKTETEYESVWAGDTMLAGNWTVNLGALYTKQHGRQLPSRSRANGLCPTCLPALEFEGFDPGFTWEDVLPRVGVTYTFDTARRHLLRGGVARYADQLGAYFHVSYNNPMTWTEIDYFWNDLDGDKLVDYNPADPSDPANEIDADCTTGPIWSTNVDPCDPGEVSEPVNAIDPGLEAPRVDELTLGYEVELMKDFTLALTYTRRERDRTIWTPLRDLVNGGIIDASFWIPDTPVSGTLECYGDAGPCMFPQGAEFDVQPYLLSAEGVALTDASRPRILTNRPGYAEHFDGLELTATKRLSNRWMFRGFLAVQEWTKAIECYATGPTGECTTAPGIQDPANLVGDATIDGSPVVQYEGWVGALGVVGSSRWQYNLNGLVQLPKNFSVAANIHGREGYNSPAFIQVDVQDADGRWGTPSMQIHGSDSYRCDDLHMVDLRLGHLLQLEGGTNLDLSLEVFNLFDEDTILGVDHNSRVLGRVEEVLGPRVVRLGARITFK